MIGNDERGSAWTHAFLGLQADVIHLCGDERALYIINKLCNITGDEVKSLFYQISFLISLKRSSIID